LLPQRGRICSIKVIVVLIISKILISAIDLLIHIIHVRECQKTPLKITDGKPYFSGVLEEEFEVSENISFLTLFSLYITFQL
jgi:hypothetical protein